MNVDILLTTADTSNIATIGTLDPDDDLGTPALISITADGPVDRAQFPEFLATLTEAAEAAWGPISGRLPATP